MFGGSDFSKLLGRLGKDIFKRLGLKRFAHFLCPKLVARAHRLVANRRADEILKKAAKQRRAVSSEEVTDILKAWSFSKNPFRVNVMPEGQKFVKSDTLGLLRDRGGSWLRSNSIFF